MLKIHSVKFNFLMNLLLTGSNFLFPLVTFPYVSRILGPEGTGKVAFAISFVTYFIMLASFGVSNYGIRAVAQVRDDNVNLSKVTQEILFINLIMMGVSYILFFISFSILDKLEQEQLLLIVTSSLIFFTIIGVEWFYKGLEQYKYITSRSIFLKLIALVLTFVFIKSSSDYIIFALISMIAIVGSGIFNVLNIRKYVSFKWHSEYEIRKHLKPMFLLFLTSFAISIYTNADATMLGFLRTDIDVGYYNAGVRVKGILLSIVTSLGVVLLPRLSYYIQNNMTTEFNIALNKSVNFIMLISLPVAVFFALFAQETILLLAGDAYEGAILPLQIIMFTILFVGITNILGIQILLPLKKDGLLLLSVVGGAVVNIGLNLYLIPVLGATGAAISTTISELVVLILQCVFVKEYLKILFGNIQYLKIGSAILTSSILCNIVLAQVSYSAFVTLVLAAVVFFGIYLLLLVFLKEKFLSENVIVLLKRKLSH